MVSVSCSFFNVLFFCRNDTALHDLLKAGKNINSVASEGWTNLVTPAGMHTLKWHNVTPGHDAVL